MTYVSEDFRILIENEGEVVQYMNLENVYREYCARSADQREMMLSKIVQTALVRHKTIPEDWEDIQPDVMPAVRSRATFAMLSLEQRSQGKPALTDLPSFGVGDHLLALLVYDMPESTQNHGQTLAFLGPHHIVQPAELLIEHFPVQEEQGRQGLILSRRGHFSLDRQMCQEGRHLRVAHLQRMPFPMKQDEAPNPVDVNLLGTPGEVSHSTSMAYLVQQLRLRGLDD